MKPISTAAFLLKRKRVICAAMTDKTRGKISCAIACYPLQGLRNSFLYSLMQSVSQPHFICSKKISGFIVKQTRKSLKYISAFGSLWHKTGKGLLALFKYYFPASISIPTRILRRDSSLPSTSMISVAPPGVLCLPETAVRTGHITYPFLQPFWVTYAESTP